MEDLWEITFIEGSWKMDEEDIYISKTVKKTNSKFYLVLLHFE